MLRRDDPRSGRERLQELLGPGFRGARLGGDDGGGYDHSDEREGDEQIMHGSVLLLRSSSELFHRFIIGQVIRILNSTNLMYVIKTVLPVYPHSC